MHDPLRLLYVGQVHPYKGVHTAIDACRQLAAKRGEDSVRLTIAGQASADYEDRLRTQANGLGGVRFLGKVEYRKLPEIYREHDIFVFPSIWREPFGLTHLEAMASGTVVVSTTEGGQGELIRDGENALTFHSEDAVSLVSAIERLLEDGDLGPRLAREARQMVVDRFTRPRYADEMEALLLQAAGRSPGPT